MAKVRFEQVSKVFDKNVTAVADFDLEINDKEFVVRLPLKEPKA